MVHRRDLLRYASVLLPAAAFSRPTPEPSLEFPKEPRARLAVTSYPFRARIESPTNHGRNPKTPGMDMTAFPSFVVEQFGVYNINPLLDHFRATDPAYIEKFRSALEDAHSHIVDLGLGGGKFYSGDSSVRQAAVEYGQKCIDVAARVGSPSVRQHVSGDEKRSVGLAAESLGRLADYGAKRNVIINLENDDPIAEDPFFLMAVIEKVSNPYIRALPDFGNCLIGHDAEYNQKAVAAMLKHAYSMCHVKDSVANEAGKLYRVDLGRMFGLAQASGYRGYFSMEYETEAGDPIEGTRQLVKETLHYLSSTQS